MQSIVGETVGGGHADIERVPFHIGCAPAEGHGIFFESDEIPERTFAVAVDGIVAIVLVNR